MMTNMWQYFTKAASPQQDVVNDSEAASSSSSSTSAYSWSRLSSYVYDKAADVAFDLAPIEQNLPLLRASAVLVELSHLVYVTQAGDVDQTSHIDLPLLGSLSNRTTVACKLLHFRSACDTFYIVPHPLPMLHCASMHTAFPISKWNHICTCTEQPRPLCLS